MPQRTCVICRRVLPKRELTRIVSTPDQGVKIDASGKAPGRGAYVCGQLTCWDKAARGDALNKALKTGLTEMERDMIAAHGARLAPQVEN